MRATLAKFDGAGLTSGYFVVSTIGKLDKSSCPSSTLEVYDYDYCKTKFCKERGFKELKSCDALKVVITDERVDFVEMKRIQPIVDYAGLGDNQEDVVRFNLLDKLIDSVVLLTVLIRTAEFGFSNEEIAKMYSAKYNYCILIDAEIEEDGVKNLAVTMGYLTQFSNDIKQAIIQRVKDNVTELTRFNNLKPHLMSCRQFQAQHT